MRIGLKVGPQEGLAYRRLADLAVLAEDLGFDAFFRSDHWLSTAGRHDRAATDAWTTLAGISRETYRIRIGTLVSPVTFRTPAALAKIVATVDEMSGGRVELGLGAGWYQPEHEPLGLRFPPVAERFEMLEEQLQIVTGLWTAPEYSFSGRHYRLDGAISEPKPLQWPRPPLIVGGKGGPRTVRLAAQYADELNLDTLEPASCAEVLVRLDKACLAVGREPDTIVRSVMAPWPSPGVAPDEFVAAYAGVGVQRLIVDVGSDPEFATLRRLAMALSVGASSAT